MTYLMQGGSPFFIPGGRVGCLLVHGFTATPQELRRMGEFLGSRGNTVLGIRLPGHSTSLPDLARMRFTDWLATVEDGYDYLRGICDAMVLVGLSLGGALSLVFAAEQPVAAVVAMATPYELPQRWYIRLLQPFLRPLSLVWRYMPKGPPDWRDPQAQKERVAYTAYPLRAASEVDRVLRRMRGSLSHVTVPVLLMHSREDDFAPPSSMPRIHSALASGDKSMVWIDHSNHIITCDSSREQVFSAAAAFVDRITKPRP